MQGKSSMEKNSDCCNCAFKFICGGGCTAKRHYCSGGLENKDVLCDFRKELIKLLLLKAYKEGWRNGYLVSEKNE